MAYQNISTPRIYLNIPEYLASTGVVIDDVFRTLPVSASAITTFPTDFGGVTLTNPYVAILGHSATAITLETANVVGGGIINGDFSGTVIPGFSIAKLDVMPTVISFDSGNAGSILLGTFFEFSHSPDLNLSLSYEYGGIKETTTKGGSTLTNAFYTKPPKWTDTLGAWELGGTAAHAKSGRRIWDLSFSYLNDSSVFPDNAGLVNETTTTDTTSSDETDLTLLEDDTFQRVIHLTNGGQLPFIFQSDNTVGATSPKPDQLAIAKFDMKSFKFSQVSHKRYTIKIKIREVW